METSYLCLVIRQIIIWSLTIAMLIQASSGALLWMDYYINQDEIVELHCENINRPELMCFARCYMNDTFIDDSDQNSSNKLVQTQLNQVVQSTQEHKPQIVYVSSPTEEESITLFTEIIFLEQSYIHDVFQPPKA